MIQADRSTAATYKKKYVNVCERESERGKVQHKFKLASVMTYMQISDQQQQQVSKFKARVLCFRIAAKKL